MKKNIAIILSVMLAVTNMNFSSYAYKSLGGAIAAEYSDVEESGEQLFGGQEVLSNGDIATYTVRRIEDGSLILESCKTGHLLDWKRKYGTAYFSINEASNPETLHMFLDWAHGTYTFANEVRNSMDFDALSKEICAKVGITDGMSDREKIKKAHDYICENHYYGEFGESVLGGKLDYICYGYAQEFCNIVNAAGVEAEFVSGTAYNGEETDGHSWNRVKVDGDWLYVDVTWDDKSSGYYYKYFLLSYDEMANNHFMASIGFS
ncbi:MAG: hypothetical protein J6M92_07440 [Oribacterium sp.]|nr:hypothetical protein [Oribacterium sp.]